MNLKKILSGFLAAAMAVTTMVTATFNAGAAAATEDAVVSSNVTVNSGSFPYNASKNKVEGLNGDLYDKWGDAQKCSDYAGVKMVYEATDWGNAKAIALCLNGGTLEWDQTSTWWTDEGEKTLVYSFEEKANETFEWIGYQLVPDDATAALTEDTAFTGNITIKSLTLLAKDTTKYADQIITRPPMYKILPGTFDASKINGSSAKIVITWTSNASDSGIQIQNEAGTTLALFDGYQAGIGSVTKEVDLSSFDLPEKIKLNAWGVASIESMTIHNDETKGDIYTPPSSWIGTSNFVFSTYNNISMQNDDTFTITFDSVVDGVGIPDGAAFDFKYKIPKIENATEDNEFDYLAPVLNSTVNGTEGQAVTGLKVSSTTSGTKTIFTFTAVSASTCKYPFMVNVEITQDGNTVDWLHFANDMGYMVLPSPHTITVDPAIKNGTVTAAPTTAKMGDKVTLTVAPATGYELDTLTVTAKMEGAAEIIVAADKTFTMPDGEVTVTATFKAPLTGITLDETATVLVGGEKTLNAAKVPSFTTDTTPITWESDNTAVATVANGVVTGVKEGTAVITATCGDYSKSCTVTVSATAIECTGITLDKTEAEVTAGKTVKLTATPAPANTTDDVAWTSSNTSVATVSSNGTVTGVAEGTATITVTCGTKSAACAVTVTPDTTPCTGITLDKTTAAVMKNATVTLTATVTPEDTTDEITWESDNTAVATVDRTGKVTGVARGTANITATCGTKSATCTVSVNEEEKVTAPADPTKPAKTFPSEITNGKYNENDVFVISAADVAEAKSVTVTVTAVENGITKKTTKDVTECYKKVIYTAADQTTDTITANGGDCLLAVTVTGIPEGTTVTVTVTVNK